MTSPRLAAWGDRICLAAFLLMLLVEFTGGIRLGEGATRFSITSAWRLGGYTAALVVLRHLLVRHPSLRERLIARRRARSSADWPGERLWLPPRRELLGAAAVLLLATAWILREQALHLASVSDHGDPLFSMWRLSTIAYQLAHDPWQLFHGNMYYPAEYTLAYSDAILLPGLIAAPFLWAGVPVVWVYSTMLVLSFPLAGLAMFLAVRTLTGRFTPALFAAVLFAFFPYRFSGYSHLEKFGVWFMPLAFLLLWRVLQHGRRGEALALGLTVAAQTLWSMYLGAFLAVALGAIAVFRWAAGHFEWRARLKSLVFAGAVAAVVLLPYSWPYWQARKLVGERDRQGTMTFSSRPSDLFTVTYYSRLYGTRLPQGEHGEGHLFPGAAAAGLAAAALIPPFSPLAGAAAAGWLVSVDGAFGLGGVTFTWLYDTVPPFRAFRAPGRFSALAAGLIAFALFELQVEMKLIPVRLEPPAIYSALPDDGRAVIVNLPVPSIYNGLDFQYIYHSTFHHRRMLNGSSGFIPADYENVVLASERFPDNGSIEMLRSRGAEFAILHADYYDSADLDRTVAGLSARQDVMLIAERPSPAGRVDRLYRLR